MSTAKTDGAAPGPAVVLQPLACIRTYDGLLEVLRGVREKSGMTLEELDFVCGLADRYCQKVLSPSKDRKLGVLSLPTLLEALNLALVVVKVPPRTEFPPVGRQKFKSLEA